MESVSEPVGVRSCAASVSARTPTVACGASSPFPGEEKMIVVSVARPLPHPPRRCAARSPLPALARREG